MFPFFSSARYGPNIGRGPDQKNGDILIVFVFLGVICAILWLLRLLLQNRRWNRIFKVQTEIHTKLLDRLSGNQELFAYLGSDAGRKLMELAPITTDINSQTAAGASGAASRILARRCSSELLRRWRAVECFSSGDTSLILLPHCSLSVHWH